MPNACSVFIVTRIRKQFKCFPLTRRSSSFCLDRSARGRDPVIARGHPGGSTSATQGAQSNGHPLWKYRAECSCEKAAAKLDILVKSYLDHLADRLERKEMVPYERSERNQTSTAGSTSTSDTGRLRLTREKEPRSVEFRQMF